MFEGMDQFEAALNSYLKENLKIDLELGSYNEGAINARVTISLDGEEITSAEETVLIK